MRRPSALALALALGALAAPKARAYDVFFPRTAVDPEEQLQNLIYYPHAGRCRTTGDFSFDAGHSGSTSLDSGGTVDNYSATFYQSTFDIACGLEEGARLGISESVLYGQTFSLTNVGASTTTNNSSSGFSDPTIFALQRYFVSETNGLYFDGEIAVTPGIGRAELAAGQSGNDFAGGWAATLSAPSYWVWGRNELELEPELHREFDTTQYGSTSGDSRFSTGFWSETFDVQDRFHLGNSLYVQPGIAFNLGYSYNTANLNANAVSNSNRQDFYVAPSVSLGCLAASWLLLQASWVYESPTTHFLPASGANTTTTQSWSNITIQAQATF